MNNPDTSATAAGVSDNTGTAASPIVYKLKIKIGVDVGGLGITTKTHTEEVKAAGLQDALQKALAAYVEKFKVEPSSFAQFSISLVTGNEDAETKTAGK